MSDTTSRAERIERPWLLIDSAPKTGLLIEVAEMNGDYPLRDTKAYWGFASPDNPRFTKKVWKTGPKTSISWKPTHWRPLEGYEIESPALNSAPSAAPGVSTGWESPSVWTPEYMEAAIKVAQEVQSKRRQAGGGDFWKDLLLADALEQALTSQRPKSEWQEVKREDMEGKSYCHHFPENFKAGDVICTADGRHFRYQPTAPSPTQQEGK